MHDVARSLSALGMNYAFGKAIQSQIASLISDPYGFYAELITLLSAVLLPRLLRAGRDFTRQGPRGVTSARDGSAGAPHRQQPYRNPCG